jgi:hypothetical protein
VFLTVFFIVMASTAPVPPLLRVATKGPLFALGEARPAQPEPQVSQPITVPIYPSCAAYAALTSNTRTSIDFDNDTPTSKPRLMDLGLANKINNLADGITSLLGSEYKLRVIKSYVQAPTPPSKNDASPYYAARASSISLSHPTTTIQQFQL